MVNMRRSGVVPPRVGWKALVVFFHLFALTIAGCGGQGAQGRQSSGVDTFPDDVFPPAIPAKNDGFSLAAGCPNQSGLEYPGNADAANLIRVVSDQMMAVARGDKDAARRTADQAFWPILDAMMKDQERPSDDAKPLDQSRVARLGPAIESPHAQLIENNCGEDTLRASWWIQTRPDGTDAASVSQSLNGNFYFIRRKGHWLIWGAE